MSINTDQIKSLRFKDLLAMTEPSIQTKRLPRASRLRKSDAEILFTETLCGATITSTNSFSTQLFPKKSS